MRLYYLLGILLFIPLNANADGKFFSDGNTPEIREQRVIISYQDGQEILIIQSNFSGEGKNFGWVIPVPNPPQLGTIKVEETDDWLFHKLFRSTRHEVKYISVFLFLFMFSGIVIVLFIISVYAIKHKTPPKFLIWILVGLCVALSLTLIPTHADRKRNITRDIMMTYGDQVTIGDTKIIKPSNSDELIEWLNKNHYKFTAEDERVFNSYIQKGWCFVAAQINTQKTKEESKISFHADSVNPFVLIFPSKEIVYPLPLTAITGSLTEMVIYVFANHKVRTDERFELAFADKTDLSLMELKIESQEELDISRFTGNYLTKFYAILSPEEMKDDLIIKPSEDDNPYLKVIWFWD
ncbi:MAG: DUF2330 domain-containing protein [Planctomycetota bacterium]